MTEKVFIYGAPGAGKTTYSRRLHKNLGYPLVEADYLREVVAQKEKTREQDPFVYVGTKEAYRLFGELTTENVIAGLKAVRTSMSPYVGQEIEKLPGNLTLEGAFLNPELLTSLGRLVLVATEDETKHAFQYFTHREQTLEQLESFKAARIIQGFLVQEAKQYHVEVIKN